MDETPLNEESQSVPTLLRRLIARGAPANADAGVALCTVRLMREFVTLGRIAEELSKSRSLSQGVMKLANSAYHGRSEINTVLGAIEYLGFIEVRRVLLTLGVVSWTNRFPSSGLLDMTAVRKRASAMACLSEDLACELDREGAFGYYEAGMYADIGFLFLMAHMPAHVIAARLSARGEDGVSVLDAERLHFSCTHADVSAEACSVMGLDAAQVEAVRYHHAPERVCEKNPFVDVLHVASAEVDAAGVMPLSGWTPTAHDEAAYARLGIEKEAAASLCAKSCERASRYIEALPGFLAA